jgi:hypothetical protein
MCTILSNLRPTTRIDIDLCLSKHNNNNNNNNNNRGRVEYVFDPHMRQKQTSFDGRSDEFEFCLWSIGARIGEIVQRFTAQHKVTLLPTSDQLSTQATSQPVGDRQTSGTAVSYLSAFLFRQPAGANSGGEQFTSGNHFQHLSHERRPR